MSGAPDLEAEARALSRYLVGRDPPRPLVDRYVRAHERLLPSIPGPADAALIRFVHRNPWSLGPLDAACGLLRPGQMLRNKILIMAAVLEASPEFAGDFLPRESGWPGLLSTLVYQGARGALMALFGIPLYLLVHRR